jgi:hypothetical protein
MEPLETTRTALATTSRQGLRLCGLEHPVSTELLDRFAAGSATRDERNKVVLHLFTGCLSCSSHLGPYWPLEDRREPESAYDQALERSFDRALQALRFRCPAA